MNTILRDTLQKADGRFLQDEELSLVEQFAHSFGVRAHTYALLREHSQALVLKTLRNLIQTHRATVQAHGPKCQRDMAYTLECIGKAILKDDAAEFHDGYLVWMENITRALHKQESAVDAYRMLKAQILADLPAESANLIAPYLDNLVQAFDQA